MTWQLRHPEYRRAIHEVVELHGGRLVIAGTTGVQIHLAAALGLEKQGPPAHAVEIVPLDRAASPPRASVVPVVTIDPLGFEPAIESGRSWIEIGPERFPVASPEHILGLILAAPQLLVDAKWACFVLMRTFEQRLDLEEVRGILKRSPLSDRQALLAELAYLAA